MGAVPRVVVLTDRGQVGGGDLVGVVAAAVAGGADGVVLREKELPRPERVELARSVARVVPGAGSSAGSGARTGSARRCRLIVASDVELAREVGADGVHLAATDPWPESAQLTVPAGRKGRTGEEGRRLSVGRSCHNRAELQEVVGRADYVTLSPVWETPSKPGHGPAVGLDVLRELCRAFPQLPVLGLGGITPERVRPCLDAGAAGVAVMGEVMRSAEPAALVAEIVAHFGRSR